MAASVQALFGIHEQKNIAWSDTDSVPVGTDESIETQSFSCEDKFLAPFLTKLAEIYSCIFMQKETVSYQSNK